MSNETSARTRSEISCLFCGTEIKAPVRARQQHEESSIRASIIRCHRCGKEAPYLSRVIFDNPDIPANDSPRARAAGMS